jgi:geranylgeranyl diphosphate synthase type I
MQQDSADNAKLILGKYKSSIDESILKFFSSFEQKIKSDKLSDYNLEAINILKEFSVRPGKRLRGALAWFTYQSASQSPKNQTGANLAVALEFIQNYLLIIDDVTDRSIIRRGKPTIHEIYKKRYKLSDGDLTTSNMMAVNIGLLAQHFANQVILLCDDPLNRINSTLKYMHQNIIKTCFGQIDDVLSVYGKNKIEKEKIYKIYESKSSYYTFISPIQLGLAMAGVKNFGLQKAVVDYGLSAGIAFQLHDDVISMFGDSKITGKPNMDDLREGKQTLLVSYAREMAGKDDVKILESALGNPNTTEAQHSRICQIMESCGAKKQVEKEALTAAKKAKNAIKKAPFFNNQIKSVYCGIVDYSINRVS